MGGRSSNCGRRPSAPVRRGSQNNSFLELTFGYNGLGRTQIGEETAASAALVGGGMAAADRGGETAGTDVRLRDRRPDLLAACTAALILLVAGLVLTREGRAGYSTSPGASLFLCGAALAD
ncbi:hypothetical protein GCM10023238_39150 [Streptomyces heliomycini]